jgi:predicted Rossmann fold nucleotide-binding protein DprA/Smf involved in DNA uptake
MVNLSKDSLATILICSNLGLSYQSEVKLSPFTVIQWNKLKEKIAYSPLKRPEALFSTSASDWKKELFLNDTEAARIQQLLNRAGQAGIEIEQLASKGIFITTRAESTYPERLKLVLKKLAPPVLYYSGNLALLESKAVTIVGSRDIDEVAVDFTCKLAQKSVDSGMQVVSGGAKGVDSLSQETALKAGGKVTAVLSDGLSNKLKSREVREAVLQGQLLLFSAVHPTAHFTVYAAMDRNKYIYALADFAVVVSSSDHQGGTWAGAAENLKNQWVPLWVRQDGTAPVGNEKLLQMGAKPITRELVNDSLINLYDWFNTNHSTVSPEQEYSQLSLESYISEERAELAPNDSGNDCVNHPLEITTDLYEVCWSYLVRELSQPRTNQELARIFNLQESQIDAWLQRAVAEEKVRKLEGNERYVLVDSQER